MTKIRLRSEALAWRDIEGEVVALDAAASTYLGANRSAALLWRRLADGATVNDLVDLLTTTFEVDPGRAREDVDGFLGQLRDHGLLEVT